MRLSGLILFAVLAAPLSALAEDAALVVANERYELADRMDGARTVVDAADALSDTGIDTQVLRDADRDRIGNALRQMEQQSRSADGLLVALVGRFVFSDDETWFLPVEAEGASLIDTSLNAIPLSAVLGLLSNAPTRAVLLLGTQLDRRNAIDAHLRHGIGSLDIPQGVTVIRAQVPQAADILSGTLAVRGASIRERVQDDDDAWVQGFVLPDLAFLPERPRDRVVVEPQGPTDAERRLWDRTERRDSEDAYVLYLETYPDGTFADRAEARLAEIRAEPFREARLTEAALDLTRDARAEIQRDLVLLGYDTRGIDGVFGQGTRGAIRNWQDANGRRQSGYLTRDMIQDIDEQARRRAAELEEERREREAERARAEAAYWTETGQGSTIGGLEQFLDRYPDGTYADQARQRLAELRRDRGDDVPDTSLREQVAWEKATDGNTIASYTEYTRGFPNGVYAREARTRIQELRQSGGDATQARAQQGEEQLGLNQITRRAVEQRLAAEGFDVGRVDGDFDRRTRSAIRAYQQDAQLPATGYLNQITVVRLLADSVRRVLQ